MAKRDFLFTSESVSEGHPDKVCDRISDAILDAFLTEQPLSRVAVETMCTTNFIMLAGEVRGPDTMNHERFKEIARQAVRDIGYEQRGFHWKDAEITSHIHSQSVDIAMGVDATGNKDEGAGDQGIMFGYACRETGVLMPAPIYYAHAILRSLAEARHSGAEPGLGPDAKSQVTLRYVDGRPTGATAIVVSTQHSDRLNVDEVREIVRPHVVNVLPEGWMCDERNFYVNPDRPLRHRRTRWRRGSHRTEDYCRYVRRRRAPRRRCVLWQRSEQGRPFRGLCCTLSGEERGCCRASGPLHHPAVLCDRRLASIVRLC